MRRSMITRVSVSLFEESDDDEKWLRTSHTLGKGILRDPSAIAAHKHTASSTSKTTRPVIRRT